MVRSIPIILILGLSLLKLPICKLQPIAQQQVPNKLPLLISTTISLPKEQSADRRSQYDVLDSEDKSLLDKFYRDTARHEDPFRKMWNGLLNHKLTSALVDSDSNKMRQPGGEVETKNRPSDWTIDTKLLEQSKLLNFGQSQQLVKLYHKPHYAKYSPTVRLLTSYNPIDKAVREASETNQERGARGNRVVGATLIGTGHNRDLARMNISSTSPTEAIKLHDELLEEPPKDGKVRVRMYFHRAIHDDPKLYGTGPWKYWGHGWGVEFGYDPALAAEGKENYNEKGYTIERAFGRDFCRDKSNCRPPEDKGFY